MSKAEEFLEHRGIEGNPRIIGIYGEITDYYLEDMLEAYHQSRVKNTIIFAYNEGAKAVSQGRFMTEGNSAEDYYNKLLKK